MSYTLFDWVSALIGFPSDYDFIIVICSALLVVIAFTCALSMVLGIVFAIFKR